MSNLNYESPKVHMLSLHHATFAFLDAIRAENSRAYFASIRPLYDEILASVHALCQELIDRTGIQHEDGRPLTPRDCMFRIYRDARRLKPGDYLYKHNFGFTISPQGKRDGIAGYYIHIQPGNTYFGCGARRPAGQSLHNLRCQLAEHGMEYQTLVHYPDFIDRFGEVQGTSLTGMPRGFKHYDQHIDLLKKKQHLIYHHYTDQETLSDSFIDMITTDIQIATPRAKRMRNASQTPCNT